MLMAPCELSAPPPNSKPETFAPAHHFRIPNALELAEICSVFAELQVSDYRQRQLVAEVGTATKFSKPLPLLPLPRLPETATATPLLF